jgi:hypothetical protein
MKFEKQSEFEGIRKLLSEDTEFEKQGKSSFCIKSKDGEGKEETLKRAFEIGGPSFHNAYEQAVSGDGNEERRITTLHSSALLPLLCFYKVNEIAITINDVVYNKVFFEVKNSVENDKDLPSNVDIALVSSNGETILFLESKLTEPLKVGATSFSKKYKFLNSIKAFEASNNEGKDCSQKVYCEGVKQMLAHYIGVISGPCSKEKIKGREKQLVADEYIKCYEEAKNLILGTILFDDKGFFEEGEYAKIERYKKFYTKCISVIAEDEKFKEQELEKTKDKDKGVKKTIKLLSEPITYQKVFGKDNQGFLDEKIAKFYGLK